MELVDFLRARLDEDEALAREAPPGPWHIGNAVDPTQPCSVHTFPDVRLVADGLNWLVAEHIAHHNPARVLAEVEAKRRIVECHEPWTASNGDTICGRCGREHIDGRPGRHFPCQTLRLLALPYKDWPGYRDEWRP